MAHIDKLIAKMKNQPNGITFNEASKVLEAKGYIFIRQKGSHCQFVNDINKSRLTIPSSPSPIKRVYVTEILRHIGEQ
ncbi:MAG: type II toxin-antitoxin system HicA family toxin [Spirochaetaceae bacterium]|nr:type II toxin-antitoxin system HicA family toxin [Spirochaetaceae bacterium]